MAVALLVLLITGGVAFMRYASAGGHPRCVITGRHLSDGCILRLNRLRIAVVKSVFTATPYGYYDYDSFYSFYHWADRAGISSCTTENLNRLSTQVADRWGRWGEGLQQFVSQSISHGYFNRKTRVLTDLQVDHGALFNLLGQRMFDVVLMGFSEYVTAREYSYYKQFVATGGKLIILSASSFIAEVTYDQNTNTERLVMGHGWSFNGTMACRGPLARWYGNNTNWVGGNQCCFRALGYGIHGAFANTSNPESVVLRKAFGGTILKSYVPHEDGLMTNATGSSTIAYWNVTNADGKTARMMRIFSHVYKKGVVLYIGIFGNDIIGSNGCLQFLVYSSMLTDLRSQAPVLAPRLP